jgi:hypothetical protein
MKERAEQCCFGPRDRVSNKGELCVKEWRVVFPGGRSVVSRVLVRCCRESEAIASDHERRQRSEQGCIKVLRSESVKEQDSTQRGDKWCIPRGRTVMSRAPVCCCWESRAITLDHREE